MFARVVYGGTCASRLCRRVVISSCGFRGPNRLQEILNSWPQLDTTPSSALLSAPSPPVSARHPAAWRPTRPGPSSPFRPLAACCALFHLCCGAPLGSALLVLPCQSCWRLPRPYGVQFAVCLVAPPSPLRGGFGGRVSLPPPFLATPFFRPLSPCVAPLPLLWRGLGCAPSSTVPSPLPSALRPAPAVAGRRTAAGLLTRSSPPSETHAPSGSGPCAPGFGSLWIPAPSSPTASVCLSLHLCGFGGALPLPYPLPPCPGPLAAAAVARRGAAGVVIPPPPLL